MALMPRIADIRASRIQFQPGDRVTVKTMHRLDENERRKLIRSIKKWAGVEVEVLLICLLDFDIEIERANIIVA